MARSPLHSRSLAVLFVGATLLPMLLALVLFGLLHLTGEKRMREELEQRAALLATALGEASEYGLISGNPAALDRSVRSLLERDRAIAAIDILDATRHPFVSLAGPAQKGDRVSVELPVRSSVPDIDFFDQPTPHVSLPDDVQPTFRLGPVVGYVRVSLSTAPFVDGRLGALRDQVLLVVLAGLLGALAALFFGRRYDAALENVLEGLALLRRGRYDLPDAARARGVLGRMQQALLALSEDLAAQADGRRRSAPTSAGASLPERPDVESRRHRARHDRVARRIVGRVDAALLAVRVAAHGVARLAESTGSEADIQRVDEAARRVLAGVDQAGLAGIAALEPLRAALLEALGLRAGLDELLQACALAHASATFTREGEAELGEVELMVAVAVHRAVQDLLVHVIAYSDAAHVALRADLAAGSMLRVVIAHDGETEDSPAARAHLTQVSDVLASVGGRLEAEASPAVLVLTMPNSGRLAGRIE